MYIGFGFRFITFFCARYDCLSKAYSDDFSTTEINTGRKFNGEFIYQKIWVSTIRTSSNGEWFYSNELSAGKHLPVNCRLVYSDGSYLDTTGHMQIKSTTYVRIRFEYATVRVGDYIIMEYTKQ